MPGEVKIPDKLAGLLEPGEKVLHAVKKLPSLEKPKWFIVTDRRVIVFDEKIFGRYELVAVPYERLRRIVFKRGMLSSEFIIEDEDGGRYTLTWMEKGEAVRAIEAVKQAITAVAVEPPTVSRRKDLFSEQIVLVKPVEGLVRGVSMGPRSPSGSVVEELERLANLLERGLISREEFERLKARLLEGRG